MAKKKTKKTTARKGGGGTDVYKKFRDKHRKQQRFGGGTYWRPPAGKSMIRLVPFKHNGEDELFVRFDRHQVDGVGNVACPGGDDCEICEVLQEQGKSATWQLKRRSTYLVNAVARETDDGENRTVIADLPVTVVDGNTRNVPKLPGLAAFIFGDDTFTDTSPVAFAVDETKGRDFQIERTGKKTDTRYMVTPAKSPTKLGVTVKPRDLVEIAKAAEKSVEKREEIAEAIRKTGGRKR